MADGDSVARPVAAALGPPDMDPRSTSVTSAPDIADHIAPDRGVESPAMDEHEMHLRRGPVHAVALRGKARSSSALSRPSMSPGMSGGEGKPEPRCARRHGRRPDGGDEIAGVAQPLAQAQRRVIGAQRSAARSGWSRRRCRSRALARRGGSARQGSRHGRARRRATARDRGRRRWRNWRRQRGRVDQPVQRLIR